MRHSSAVQRHPEATCGRHGGRRVGAGTALAHLSLPLPVRATCDGQGPADGSGKAGCAAGLFLTFRTLFHVRDVQVSAIQRCGMSRSGRAPAGEVKLLAPDWPAADPLFLPPRTVITLTFCSAPNSAALSIISVADAPHGTDALSRSLDSSQS